jgi:hypothetical protein
VADRYNVFLSSLGDESDKHDPNHENAGNQPNEKIIMLVHSLLFFFDSHIRFPLSEGL